MAWYGNKDVFKQPLTRNRPLDILYVAWNYVWKPPLLLIRVWRPRAHPILIVTHLKILMRLIVKVPSVLPELRLKYLTHNKAQIRSTYKRLPVLPLLSWEELLAPLARLACKYQKQLIALLYWP